INTYWFRARIKEPKNNNDSINYIPEEIWNQLEKHLSNFPPPMQRKVIIIRTLGLRIGELLNLPFDCLRKRGGQWRLRLKETEKFKIEDELPIPKELVLIIKEQQDYIANNLGDSYQKLFCANQTTAKNFKFRPTAKVMNTNVFGRWLNKLAKKYNICSADGKIWHFKSHQFRRTVATVMTNAGVRDLIIQKYLRHRNSEMLKYYTHQLKEVLGDEYLELIKEKNWVNIEGKVVNIHKPENAIEEYVRLKLHQITTQQGECHRSNIKNSCPTVNGCWRCKDWMTSEQDLPYLKQDLKRLKNELKKANELGMLRVEKEIQKDINFLQIRINTLEETTNND
ncbi:MAG: tyrosine-type recombinase/integrase, partial [Crocosphaera sp.]